MRSLLIPLALAACSKRSAPAPTCNDAARRAVRVFDEKLRAEANALAPDQRAGALARLEADEASSRVLLIVIDDRCVEDQWAPSVISCFANATTYDALRTCDAQLTAEQRRMLRIAEAAVVEAAMKVDAADAAGDAGAR